MTILQAIILGIIQGLTEYLPISSTAHLRIIPALCGWPDPGAAFTAVIQLGTLLAVFVYFRGDLRTLIAGSYRELAARNYAGRNLRLGAAILVGTVPIGVAGLLGKHWIENELRGLPVIAGALIALALLLAWAEKAAARNRGLEALSFWEIQLIGLAQALALIPGASRSGTTLTAALWLGLRRDEAARFSFLLGIPAIAAAGLFELKELVETGFTGDTLMTVVIGTGAAFGSGLLAISFLLHFLKKHSTLVFIGYRLLLGAAILALWSADRLR